MATNLTLSPSSSSLTKAIDHVSLIRKGLAAVKKHVKSNKLLISQEDGDKQTLFHVAAAEGDLEIMNWLLKHSKPADLKKRDKTGWTPLHVAGHGGKQELYEALLRKGASPNAQNAHLTSPFAYLCRYVVASLPLLCFCFWHLAPQKSPKPANPLSEHFVVASPKSGNVQENWTCGGVFALLVVGWCPPGLNLRRPETDAGF